MPKPQLTSLDELLARELKTGRAWSLKKMFRAFWSLTNRDSTEYFFEYWSEAVVCSEMRPMIKDSATALRTAR